MYSERDIKISDFITIKQYSDDFFKVIYHCLPVRLSGFELLDSSDSSVLLDCSADSLEFLNDRKLDNNVSRARNTVFELVYCNDWDWFFTGTLAPRNGDRTDLNDFRKKFTRFIRNLRSKKGFSINYLLVPETHFDCQSWHFHGLISGLPFSELEQFRVGMKMGKGIADKVLRGDLVFDWPRYSRSFGWCDLEPIRNKEAVSKYLVKYIYKTFDTSRGVTELYKHLYYCSSGLQRAKVIKKGFPSMRVDENLDWQFENEYVKVFSTRDASLINNLCDSLCDLNDFVNGKMKYSV